MIFSRTPQQPAATDSYPDAVVAIVTEHLGADETTQRVIRDAIVAQRATPTASFEVIVDSPFTANWRLRPVQDDPRRVRLGDYRMPPRHGDLPVNARAEAINAALALLP